VPVKQRDVKRQERTAFLVKTSKATAEQLKLLAKERRIHRVALVEGLLDAIAQHPDRLSELHSEDATPAESLERLMVDIDATNRDLQGCRFLSAEEALDRILNSKHYGERFSNWAHNRRAYCWLALGHDRREEALRLVYATSFEGESAAEPAEIADSCCALYAAAIKCLHRSIGFGQRVNGPLMWVARFNVACSNALISAYLCERGALDHWLRGSKRPSAALGPKHDKVTRWIEAGFPSDFASDVYTELAQAEQASVKSPALEGIRCLEQVVRDLRRERSAAVHVSWLLRSCGDPRRQRARAKGLPPDPDLDFLRNTDEFKARFQRVVAGLEDQRRSVNRWFEEKLAVD
jgi:hypothetical protein